MIHLAAVHLEELECAGDQVAERQLLLLAVVDAIAKVLRARSAVGRGGNPARRVSAGAASARRCISAYISAVPSHLVAGLEHVEDWEDLPVVGHERLADHLARHNHLLQHLRHVDRRGVSGATLMQGGGGWRRVRGQSGGVGEGGVGEG